MRKIQQSYVTYYRYKYNTTKDSRLKFEGRFKSKYIDTDEYFIQCQSYVNYNAVKHSIVDKIESWPYTSIHNIINTGRKPLNNFNLYGYSYNMIENIELLDDGFENQPGL